MDPVTSATLYVALTLLFRFMGTKVNGFGAIFLMLLVVLNSAQLAFFTGLWPFYVFAAIDGLVSLFIIGHAINLAMKDANNA